MWRNLYRPIILFHLNISFYPVTLCFLCYFVIGWNRCRKWLRNKGVTEATNQPLFRIALIGCFYDAFSIPHSLSVWFHPYAETWEPLEPLCVEFNFWLILAYFVWKNAHGFRFCNSIINSNNYSNNYKSRASLCITWKV